MDPISLLSQFPQELIDQVIQETGQSQTTLRSCALVCRAFLPAAQTRIFSHINLISTEPTESRSCRRLQQIFQDSPHLCGYVRSLRIYENGCVDPAIPGPWMFTLIAVLSKLTALTSFVFEARNHDSRWMNIPKELRMAICTLCKRSSLVNLGLLNLRTFAELDEFAALVAAPTLSDISFRSIELPTVAETESAAHTQLRPTRCSLRLAHPTLSIMMRWLADGDVSQLQHLEVNWAPGMTDHLQRLMDDSAQSLEKLWLIADHSPLSYAPHNLIFPAKLCHLHLTFSLHVSETDTMTPWIANVLEPSHGPSHLITIVVQISLRRPLHPLAPIPPIDWAPLASILTAAQFPVLRSLLLEIKALGSDAQLKVVAEEARKALRDLDVRGILTCQATSWRVLRR